MDIQNLILIGKLGETVNFKTNDGKMLEVGLMTPTAEVIRQMGTIETLTSIEFVANFIIRIGDKTYAPADKAALREELGQIQGAVLGLLNKQCLSLIEKQEKFVEELTKK